MKVDMVADIKVYKGACMVPDIKVLRWTWWLT